MADVLIANESKEHDAVAVGEGDPIVIAPRTEITLPVADGLSVTGEALLIISQADVPLMVTQGESGVVLAPGERYLSVIEDAVIFISEGGNDDEAV